MAVRVRYFLSKRGSFQKAYSLSLMDDESATGHTVTGTNFC
jgi:hypothetical protein